MQLHLNLPVQIQLASKFTLNKSIRQSYFTGILGNEIEHESYNSFKFTENDIAIQNGIETEYKKNTIKLNGTSKYPGTMTTGLNTINNRKSIGKFKPGTYTVFMKHIKGTVDFGVQNTDFAFYLYDGAEGSALIGLSYKLITQKKTFTLTEEKEIYFGSYINQANGIFTDYEIGFITYEGTDEKPYIPYGTTYKELSTGLQTIEVGNKNIWKPTLTNDEQPIQQTRCTVELNEDEYTFTATGSDMYFGNVVNTGLSYGKHCGILYEIKDKKTIVVSPTNKDFTTIYLTQYDENKKSLGFELIKIDQPKTLNDSTKYFSLRIGCVYSVEGTVYKTKIQVEYDTATDYIPHQSQSYELDLGENTLGKHDYIYKYGINWYIFKFETDEDVLIVDENLINQLENIKENIHLYDGTTHVAITSEKEPSIILDLSYYENK